MTKTLNIIGNKYGRWTVLGTAPKRGKLIYWKCRCDCGREYEQFGGNLKNGNSFGCAICAGRKLPDGQAGFNRAFHDYEMGAKRRNLAWDLTREYARELFLKDCSYCGKKVMEEPVTGYTCGKFTVPFFYNGIDRIDNKQGYIMGNVTTCCMICNRAKNSMSVEVFQAWIDRIKKVDIINHITVSKI
jgi:hypothetical protein